MRLEGGAANFERTIKIAKSEGRIKSIDERPRIDAPFFEYQSNAICWNERVVWLWPISEQLRIRDHHIHRRWFFIDAKIWSDSKYWRGIYIYNYTKWKIIRKKSRHLLDWKQKFIHNYWSYSKGKATVRPVARGEDFISSRLTSHIEIFTKFFVYSRCRRAMKNS